MPRSTSAGSPARQEQFLKALAETGSVATSAALAGTSRTRVYELRKADQEFAGAWEDAEEIAADRLEGEARRRAVEGVEEPLAAQVNWFAMKTVNRSLSHVIRITCF